MLTTLIKKSAFLTSLARLFLNLSGRSPEKRNLDFHKKRSSRIISDYLNNEQSDKKLQIGCQVHLMSGWLNVDILPKHNDIVYMDATKKFPFPNDVFKYIFCEHMIEHIRFKEGAQMLQECYRVMKKGGRIRIATPNLKFLCDLYGDTKTETQGRYVSFSKKYLSKDMPLLDATVINNFFRAWGHQFIYDEKSLHYVLNQAGFKNITFEKVGFSTHPEFRNIEKHGLEISEEFNILESIVIEGEK